MGAKFCNRTSRIIRCFLAVSFADNHNNSAPEHIAFPGLVLVTPVAGESVDEYQRVIIFRGNRRVPQIREDFFVDVPFGVAPGGIFRVYVRGREYDVVCPDIGVSGERIVISYLYPHKGRHR